MMKLMILDDEMLIRKMLEKIIEWNNIDIEVVGVGGNGEEGYKIYKETEPDIVITDIKMPVCDGLSLITRIREEGDDRTKFIIMSAFADFKYAQSAVKLRCEDYILKPLDKEKLREVILGVIEKIKVEQSRGDEDKKKHLYEYMKTGKLTREVEELDLKDYYLINMTMVSETVNQSINLENLDNEQVEKIKKLVKKYSNEGRKLDILSSHDMEWSIIMTDVTTKEIEETYSKVIKELEEEIEISARVCFSKRLEGVKELSSAYKELVYIDRYSSYLNENKLVSHDVNSGQDKFEEIDIVRVQHKIIEELEGGRKEDALEIYQEVLKASVNITPKELNKVYNLSYGIIILIKEMLIRNKIDKIDKELDISYEKLLEYKSIIELRGYMEGIILKKGAEFQGNKEEKHSQLIERCIGYLEENYNKNFSLDDVSSAMYISKNYLCNLFKKECGKSLWSYLTDIRMEKAKVLLEDRTMMTYEIANELGYENPNYFSRIFKKTYNITPSEYRNKR